MYLPLLLFVPRGVPLTDDNVHEDMSRSMELFIYHLLHTVANRKIFFFSDSAVTYYVHNIFSIFHR